MVGEVTVRAVGIAAATLDAFGAAGTESERLFLALIATVGWHEYGDDQRFDATQRANRALAFGKGVSARLKFCSVIDRITVGELRGRALSALTTAFREGSAS